MRNNRNRLENLVVPAAGGGRCRAPLSITCAAETLPLTDVTGNMMRYSYGQLGRTVSIRAPQETTAGAAYTWHAQYGSLNFYAVSGIRQSYTNLHVAVTSHYPQHPDNPMRTATGTRGCLS